MQIAGELSAGSLDKCEIARRVFEWVRDNIEHTTDFDRTEVTCRASEVLAVGTGLCYAKSHLLAALMRACSIPSGFCYQRLSMDGNGSPFCLHGFNSVYLEPHGWYRVDARGNTENINCQFSPPTENLAFDLTIEGEQTFDANLAEPNPVVVNALKSAMSAEELCKSLPDLDQVV